MVKASPQWRIGIVYSQWYPEIVDALRESAVQELMKHGISEDHITQHASPGSFEIPLIGRNLAEKKSVDALIALGVIVQGETHHADLIATEVARGCMEVQLRYGIPFGFEVLYVDDISLAQARRERGEEAAKVVISVLDLS
jgi:6,7-dimethyl-8-ribityllumazine synthase